jgi:branched-chain amino acid aminotransferase
MTASTKELAAVWVDGVLDGGVPGDDPGLLLGMTVFETLRTYAGVPFRLGPHIDRLLASAEALRIKAPTAKEISSEIMAVCVGDVSLRYTLTGGGHKILQRAPISPGTVGRTMRVGAMTWINPLSLPGAVKHGCRAAWILAAKQRGVDEVLLIDERDNILEANRSNVFAVVDGNLWTPPLDGRQLAGVTREALLEAAADVGLEVREATLPLKTTFQELYLASTLKELAPVVELEGQALPQGGPVGRRLYDSFRGLVLRETA